MTGAAPAAADRVSYTDLYARWECAGWRATQIDFGVDRRDWTERLSAFERRAVLWNCALFGWGEDAVADTLAPFIDAAAQPQQRHLLATQQADEVRHSVFFSRFLSEVPAAYDDVTPQLPRSFLRIFELLRHKAAELRGGASPTMLAQAVTLYHVIVEGMLAQPGQHVIETALEKRALLPGLCEGLRRIGLDEERHIAIGVKLLRDLADDDRAVPAAVADLLRAALPYALTAYAPPNGDRRYAESLGFTLEELFELGARSLESRLRAAGLPIESLPGPIPYRYELAPAERARRGVALVMKPWSATLNSSASR